VLWSKKPVDRPVGVPQQLPKHRRGRIVPTPQVPVPRSCRAKLLLAIEDQSVQRLKKTWLRSAKGLPLTCAGPYGTVTTGAPAPEAPRRLGPRYRVSEPPGAVIHTDELLHANDSTPRYQMQIPRRFRGHTVKVRTLQARSSSFGFLSFYLRIGTSSWLMVRPNRLT